MAFTYFVIGSGSIGRRHFANLKTMGKSTELLSWRRFGAQGITQKLASHTGNAAVIIATATDIRAELVAICAANHAPMYIEKPLAFTRAEFDKIYSINADLQKRSIVGFMLRYHPLTDFLVNLPPQSFFRLQLEIGHDVRQWRENWRFAESYAARAQGGGVLLDLCHEIDLIGLMCPDLSLRDVTSIGHAAFPGVDIASSLSLASGSGATATVSMDYLSPVLKRGGSLTGDAQNIVFDFVTNTATVTMATGVEDHNFNTERNNMFEKIMQDFVTLAEETGDATHDKVPRMDRVKTSCARIVEAWERRDFIGTKKVDLQ